MGQPPESVVFIPPEPFRAGLETGPIMAAGGPIFGVEKACFKAFAGLENQA
jgi:hypothetical protein